VLVDANLLIYAVRSDSQHHDRARDWVTSAMSGSRRVGLPWPTLLAFLRLNTNPVVFQPPMPIDVAWDHVVTWLARDVAWVPQPTEEHATVLGRLLTTHHLGAKLVHDAHLAALAIEHGLTVVSADTDFARFPDIRWENPLEPRARRG
jgi:toxin-antitoxin system PIN domain toxin